MRGAGGLAEERAPAPEGLPRGRLIELASGPGAARTTAAVQILLASQREGDPVAWIQPRGGALFPPDVSASGLDLGALLVVHVPPEAGRAGLPKAAEMVLRTGAFGALVVDLSHPLDQGQAAVPRGGAWLGRLAGLAREHDCRCVFLGGDAAGSLGPLVALRLRVRRTRLRPGRFGLETVVLKDKSGWGPTLPAPTRFGGPAGMP